MENNKIIQTSPVRKMNNKEKRTSKKKLRSIRKYDLTKSNKHNNTESNKKNITKDNEEHQIIQLESGAIIGKLYKKTNETEWAAQNRAIKEKNPTNYDIKQILKRYNFNKGKIKYGFSDEYINLITELLYSPKKDYSKERLKLSKQRINLTKKRNKDKKNFINNYLNISENKNDNLPQKMTISAVGPSFNNNQYNSINENKYLNTFYNIKKNNENIFYSAKNNKKRKFLINKEIYNKNNYIKSEIQHKNGNNLFLLKSLYDKNKIKEYKFSNNNKIIKYNDLCSIIPNRNKISSNTIYSNIFNKPKINNLNLSSKSFDKSDIGYSPQNSPKKKTKYKNERDIYFEKEKELDEFLMSGDKDKYEDYLKDKFGFFEDMEDKQTQYIYEIKKRNATIFNNRNIEMQNNRKLVDNYLSKLSRGREGIEKEKKYKIHDLFKHNYTSHTLNKIKLNNNSKKILKNLKYVLK